MTSSVTAVTATIHFTDRTRLVIRWPRRSEHDPATIASNVRQALEANQMTFAIDGDLMVIPLRSVKYVHITPAPPALPSTVILGATIVEDTEGTSDRDGDSAFDSWMTDAS